MNFKYIHIVIFNTSHTLPSLRKRQQRAANRSQSPSSAGILMKEKIFTHIGAALFSRIFIV